MLCQPFPSVWTIKCSLLLTCIVHLFWWIVGPQACVSPTIVCCPPSISWRCNAIGSFPSLSIRPWYFSYTLWYLCGAQSIDHINTASTDCTWLDIWTPQITGLRRPRSGRPLVLEGWDISRLSTDDSGEYLLRGCYLLNWVCAITYLCLSLIIEEAVWKDWSESRMKGWEPSWYVREVPQLW